MDLVASDYNDDVPWSLEGAQSSKNDPKMLLGLFFRVLPKWLKNAEKMGKDLLQRLGVGDKTNNKPSSLSGGEQQRVAVARALINKPKIIFADEPSGNLDSNNANQLHDLFFELRDELGCSFIIVTHNKTLAERADRIISLKDGNILT